jgi:hypothetical protein
MNHSLDVNERVMVEARGALATLEAWNEPIAKYLYAAGIRGERKSAYFCPITNFLVTVVKARGVPIRENILAVGQTTMSIHDPAAPTQSLILAVRVGKFIADFDAGLYPELETNAYNSVVV